MQWLDTLRSSVLALPDLAKFPVVIAVMVGIPPIARRVRLPDMIGLLLFGIILGPHVLGFFGEKRPIADFLAELGKLLLMFSAGLPIIVTIGAADVSDTLSLIVFAICVSTYTTGFSLSGTPSSSLESPSSSP
jgi:predicted Kef-type K+ transport protein